MAAPDLLIELDERLLVGESYAAFSPCRTWRYSLVRRFAPGPLLRVVGLNPSTADAFRNDPTVTRCVRRSAQGGFGGLLMQNLFGLRSTDPQGLLAANDPVGPQCDELLLRPNEPVGATLVAWGAGGSGALRRIVRERVQQVVGFLEAHPDVPVWCLGTTSDGSPRHPLYVSNAVAMQPWSALGRSEQHAPPAPRAEHTSVAARTKADGRRRQSGRWGLGR